MSSRRALRTSTPYSRRKILIGSGATAAGLATMALAGCGSDDDDEAVEGQPTRGLGSAPTQAGTPTEQPKSGGTLEYTVGSNLAANRDPHTTSDSGMALLWMNASHHLVGWDPSTGKVRDTEASKSFEQPDSTTMVFKLWPGIKWQQTESLEGRAFTADDVVYNIKRLTTNDAKFVRRSLFSDIDSVSATDASTVVIKSKKPSVPLLTYLATGYSVMTHPSLNGADIKDIAQCSGIGPFALKKVDGNGALLERNPSYFQSGLPYADKINITAVNDLQTQISAFRSGSTHIMNPGSASFPYEAEDELVKAVKGLQLLRWNNASVSGVIAMNYKSKPYDDPRVRQAVSLVIDRHAMKTQAFRDHFVHLRAPVPWAYGELSVPEEELATLPGYRKDKTQDLKDATALLASAGLKPEDIQVSILASNTTPAANYETLLPQMNRFGFKLTLETVEGTVYSSRRNNRDFVWMFEQGTIEPEVDAILRNYNYSGASRNSSGFADPEVDRLIDQQAQEFDRAKRVAQVRDLAKRLIEKPNLIHTVGVESQFAAKPEVRNFYVSPISATLVGADLTRTWLA